MKALGGGVLQQEAVSSAANRWLAQPPSLSGRGLPMACGFASLRRRPWWPRLLSLEARSQPLPAARFPAAAPSPLSRQSWRLGLALASAVARGAVVAGLTPPDPWSLLQASSEAVSLVVCVCPGQAALSPSFTTSVFAFTAGLVGARG